VGALSEPPPLPPGGGRAVRPAGPAAAHVEDVAWFRIDGAGPAGQARRVAAETARALGLPAGRVDELAVAVAEMVSNLTNHATDGSVLIRRLRRDGVGGVEVIAVDAGPGMPDADRSRRDGHSTAGTLGIGLGAIERLASWSDMFTWPGSGTVLAAQFWPADTPYHTAEADGLTRPITGEQVCGDGFAVRRTATGLVLALSDGLGHGLLAAAATRAAVDAFLADHDSEPAAIVERIHRRLSHTRGAALGVAAIDRDAGVVSYAGLGNVAGHVVAPGHRRTMVSLPGIAGHRRSAVRQFEYPLPPDAAVVLHSDGLTDRWSLDGYPGLLDHAPVVVAATLLRDAGLRRDDAGVLVARPTGGPAGWAARPAGERAGGP
jgi:anti-sigma regulatory factor (Ser/Thr protein kinase)